MRHVLLHLLLCMIALAPRCVGYPPQNALDLSLRLEECRIQQRTLIMTYQYRQNELTIAMQQQAEQYRALLQYVQSLETTVQLQHQMIQQLTST